MQRIIAVDCGAESGRVSVGTLSDGRIDLEVIHRFPNGPRTIAGSLRWDLPALFNEIKRGLTEALRRYRGEILSIGVDTWGVDYALFDSSGTLLELPYTHRDRRTAGLVEAVDAVISPEELYSRTGVQPMQINTLYQLVAHSRQQPETLERAAYLLTMPDALHYWLSGEMRTEWSIAGTTQLAVAGTPEWDFTLIERLGLPQRLFRPIARPGTRLARMRTSLAQELNVAGTPPWIVLPGAHDTASAVAASPGDALTTAYLSSGTWSLMGVVNPHAITTPAMRAAGLSNEIGTFGDHGGAVRINQNIMGLWLVQECRRGFAAAGRDYTYAQLADLAAAAPPSGVALAVNDPRFLAPGEGKEAMPERIRSWLAEHGHAQPQDDGALIRLVLDGLAAAYGRCLADLARLVGRDIRAVHLIGGGSQNRLLCQLTADACGLPVIAGPVEATALGSVAVQAMGLGLIATPQDVRQQVCASVKLETFTPGQAQKVRQPGG